MSAVKRALRTAASIALLLTGLYPLATATVRLESADDASTLYVHGVDRQIAGGVCESADIRAVFECEDAFETAVAGRAVGQASFDTIEDAFAKTLGSTNASVGSESLAKRLGGTIHAQTAVAQDRLGVVGTIYISQTRKLREASGTPYLVQRPAPPHLSFLHSKQRAMCPDADPSSTCTIPIDAYHYKSTGRGVTVYMAGDWVDDQHVDFLQGRVSQYLNASGVDLPAPSPCSTWYGTHYAALAIGLIHGAAKSAHFVSTPVTIGCLQTIPLRDTLRGLQWVLDDIRQKRARDPSSHSPALVMTTHGLSIDSTDPATVAALEDIVLALVQANVTVMSFAGARNADACAFTPARMPGVITVGAIDIVEPYKNPGGAKLSRPWFQSNYGPCVDIWSPGTYIESASSGRDVTAVMSGTFQATSIATGVAATILEEQPDLSPAGVKSALLQAASSSLLLTNRPRTTSLVLQVPFTEPVPVAMQAPI